MYYLTVFVGQKSWYGFIGSPALAGGVGAVVSSQGFTREGFTFNLSWLLAGHSSSQFVGLNASISNWLLARGTISSLPRGLPNMAAYFIKASKREFSSKTVT